MNALGDHDTRVRAAGAARREAYGQLGIVEPDVLAPMLGPAVLGGAQWPTRPAWRVVQRDGRTAIASDALSDPWDDEFGTGFGLELWIEADEPVGIVAGSWLLTVITDVSYTAAGHGGVRTLLDERGVLSVEIGGRPFPAALRNEHGRIGVLLGVPSDLPPWLTLPEGRAKLVPITILTAPELAHAVAHGDAGRVALARRLAASPTGMRSSLTRPSVI